MNFLIETLRLGLSNLLLHKLRSLLTALGIIFGVAAVIIMVSIGEGNKRRLLAEIRRLGADRVLVRSVKPPESTASSSRSHAELSYGLTRVDLRRVQETVAGIQYLVPLKQVGSRATRVRHRVQATVLGTTPLLREVASLSIERGRYLTDLDGKEIGSIVVIGSEIARGLFPLSDPLDGEIRVGDHVFRVVGVLAPLGGGDGTGSALVGRNMDFDIHLPIETAVARYGDLTVRRQSGTWEATRVELSALYIQSENVSDVRAVADQLSLLLDREHKAKGDIEMVVPLELLNQAERTQRMFNVLMVSIASISLLVGGIGIMNIMLASVTERTREIGIRRALGATRRHITAQFLVETAVLSGLGGLIGVAVGLGGTVFVGSLGQWFPSLEIGRPYVTMWPITLSFNVAVLVGIVFGLYPAIQAANRDPIVALRHD